MTKIGRKFLKKKNQNLEKILGDKAIDLQHIGSTSVPGSCAKPIIDILIGVSSMKIADECIEPLNDSGYEFKGGKGIPGGYFFTKSIDKMRTHHLHIIIHDSKSWIDHVIFRDFLIQHKEFRKNYCHLKRELSSQIQK